MSALKSTGYRSIPMLLVAALLAASPLAAEDSRWYLAGKLGQATVKQNFGPPVLGWRVDEEDAAASVEVGYALHRYLGLQAGYHDLGEYTGLVRPCPPGEVCPLPLIAPLPIVAVFPVAAEFTGFSLSAVPRWPVTERFSVYGKLGVLDWEGTLRPTYIYASQPTEHPSDRDLLAGIGAQYAFPKGFGLLLEYEGSELLDAVSLGASWRF